jgi:hypothetical protein
MNWRGDSCEGTICKHCNLRRGLHRATDGRCPASGEYPKWPTTIADETKAAALYDARMAAFWGERSTVFRRAL